ncbi:MAG: DUF6817 domain-containing protein [Marinomonas sp.]
MDTNDVRFKALEALGAGEFDHLNGSLISHLTGTFKMLKAWGAADYVCDAGLFHAAYGTAGFDETMVSLSQRAKIAEVIGKEAEALVYLYCSCDRDYVFESSIGKDPIAFKDRFTGECFTLDDEQACAFCELTLANELELLLTSEAFVAKYGAELYDLFENIQHYLTDTGVKAYKAFYAKEPELAD